MTDGAAAIRTAPLRRLYAEWRALRGARAMPPFAAFDPLRTPQSLGRITVLAIERAPLRFRYRIFSTRAAETLGIEMTGRHLDELPDADERAITTDRLQRCLGDPRPTVIVRTTRGRINFVTFESLMLPFADDGITVDTVLFGLSTLTKEPAWRHDGEKAAVLDERVVEDE